MEHYNPSAQWQKTSDLPPKQKNWKYFVLTHHLQIMTFYPSWSFSFLIDVHQINSVTPTTPQQNSPEWRITNIKTPPKAVETPSYHKNIALHNLQETKQITKKTNHPHLPFTSLSTIESFVMFFFLTIGNIVSSS